MNRKTMQPVAFLAVMILSSLLLHDKTDVEADKSKDSIQLVAAADGDPYIEGDCIDVTPAAFAVPPDIETEPHYGLSYDYLISDFSIIWQMPELPTGCEITALAMVLQYFGYEVDKTALAAEYLPVVAYPEFYYGGDGNLYGPDMRDNFVGNPFSEWGYICGAPTVLSAANPYLLEEGGGHAAADLTGASTQRLYELVAADIPVVVWVTIEMSDRYEVQGWYTESGEYMEWSTQDHCAVLIGCSQEAVTIADPISGITEYDRGQFESVFESRGRQCVIIEETTVGTV